MLDEVSILLITLCVNMITNVFLVIAVLSDSNSFPKGSDYDSSFAVLFGEGLVTSAHEKHRNDRSTFNKYFIRSNVNKSMDMYNEVSAHAVDQLLDDKLGDKTEMDVDIEFFFAKLALRVFMNFCCGTDYRKDLAREDDVRPFIHFYLWHVLHRNLRYLIKFILLVDMQIGIKNQLPGGQYGYFLNP